MSTEVHLWRIGQGDDLTSVDRGRLDLEERLEDWLEADISILDPGLLVIGRQVQASGGPIDLLCIDAEGDLVIVELKRDRTPRDVTAQALDYASWVEELSKEDVCEIADAHIDGGLDQAFNDKFGEELPEAVNADHRILVVGSEVDSSTERILRYLSGKHGVNINAATFHYFQPDDGPELLARVFVIEPAEVEQKSRSRSKRGPILSLAELEEHAEKAGVGDLYGYAIAALEAVPSLQTKPQRRSIGFTARLDGSPKAVFTLDTADSSAEAGLHYWLYRQSFAEVAGIPATEVEKLLPPEHDSYSDHQEGFMKTRDEIKRVVDALGKGDASA